MVFAWYFAIVATAIGTLASAVILRLHGFGVGAPCLIGLAMVWLIVDYASPLTPDDDDDDDD